MDTQSGEVRAIGAGRKGSKSTFKGHNMATDLKRQVGSTMKPILTTAQQLKIYNGLHTIN